MRSMFEIQHNVSLYFPRTTSRPWLLDVVEGFEARLHDPSPPVSNENLLTVYVTLPEVLKFER